MKKLILFLCLLMAIPAIATKKTFKAACLNVDGLPPTVDITGITKINMNPEGPQETGTAKMSELVANKGWDFFAVSEAFNYNDILMSKIKGQYTAGTFRETIPTSLNGIQALQYVELNGTSIREDRVKKSFDTDGLNLIYKNSIRVSGERWQGWNDKYGVTKNGSDLLIDKGYRYYTVSLGAGLDIDVYILHMDAETSAQDNAARESQINQLVADILQSNNKRPVIIMGDTNCRYTRDRLKELLIDRINADERFEIHDPWIDYMWDGQYPNVGDNALMVTNPALGHQKGEVVDKIFYINNTDAPAKLTAHGYLHDMDFTWPDGSEISDHFPIVINFTIENNSETVSPGEYYLKNVATGKFLQAGGIWDTQATLSGTGRAVTFEAGDTDHDFILNTNLGDGNLTIESETMESGSYMMYTDGGNSETRSQKIWNITTDDAGRHMITCTRNDKTYAITAEGDVVAAAVPDATDENQLWELLTKEELRNSLLFASEDNPADATFMMKGYRFGRNDSNENQAWVLSTDNNGKGKLEDNNVGENYSMYKLYNTSRIGKTGSKITQTISDLPNGTYIIACDFAQGNNNGVVTANGITIPTNSYTRNDSWGEASVGTVGKEFATGNYQISTRINVSDGSITLIVEKVSTSSKTALFVDNFSLTYLGPDAETLAALEKVKAAIDDAAAKAEAMNYYSYDNSVVQERYDSRKISADGSEEVHMTYLALANAARKVSSIPADMRYTILNNSFEMGDLSEWNTSGATNARVTEDNPVDGRYIFSADGGAISQTIQVTMPTGVYELKASVSSGASLTAGTLTSAPAQGDGMQEVSLRFIISKGTETIGVKADGAFSADNFTITRIADEDAVAAFDIVSLAIRDATERVNEMGSPYSDGWDLSKYQEMLDNLSIEGDGMKEFNEIYSLLREKVFSQPVETGGADYTHAIINPDFEFGNTLGWSTILEGEMGVKELSNPTYATSAANGNYIFNTWRDGKGAPISQTIQGLPSGHYRLVVTLASDQGQHVWIQVNDKKEGKLMERAANIGSDYFMEFDVAKDTREVTITIRGGDTTDQFVDIAGTWYKADNFRLYRHDDGEFKTCDFYNRLQTAIRRIASIAATLPDKYRTQWDAHDYEDLIEQHINSEHKEDPMGTNGSKEIDELFSRFRALVLSQTETDADMSGAIRNFSFELGDLTGWNISSMDAADTKVTKGNENETYRTEGIDGDYLFNTYYNNKSNPVYQDIKGMPAGRYRLSALIASDEGNRFYLAAGDSHSEMITTGTKTKFDEVSLEFDVEEDNTDVRIGIYPSADGSFNTDTEPLVMGPWFKADNFNLTLIGRRIDVRWKMECENTGTIILPFDAEVPADLEIHSIMTSEPSATPGDNNFYHIATISTVAENTIKGNTPYLVTKKTTSAPSAKSVRKTAPVADANGYYTFSGMTTHKADTYTNGLLTGTLVKSTAKGTDHHLHTDAEGNVGFFYHDGTYEHEFVEPYHVYISTGSTEGVTLVPPVYLEEPALPLEWAMETPACGTLILPFDAELPEGLEAYSMVNISANKTFTPEGETDAIEYQVIEISESAVTEIGANTPYFVKTAETSSAVAENDEEPSVPTLNKYKFSGKATNTEDSYMPGGQILTGLLMTKSVAPGSYMLRGINGDNAFVPLESAQDMPPYHAYIPSELATAPLLLLSDPENEDIPTGIENVLSDPDSLVDIYTTGGICLRSGVRAADALRDLAPGLYILRNGKKSLTIMKRR